MLFLSMFTFSEPNAIQIIKEILYLMSYRSSSNAIKNDASKHKRKEATKWQKTTYKEEVLLSHISSLIILIKNIIKRHNFYIKKNIINIYLKKNPTESLKMHL